MNITDFQAPRRYHSPTPSRSSNSSSTQTPAKSKAATKAKPAKKDAVDRSQGHKQAAKTVGKQAKTTQPAPQQSKPQAAKAKTGLSKSECNDRYTEWMDRRFNGLNPPLLVHRVMGAYKSWRCEKTGTWKD